MENAAWDKEHGTSQPSQAAPAAGAAAPAGAAAGGGADGGAMVLPPGTYQPARPWANAKAPNKKGKPQAWEESYRLFTQGEHPQAIAMKSEKGVALDTVAGHIFKALEQGMPVDLGRLCDTWKKPPGRAEWAQLEEAEMALDVDVTTQERVNLTSLLANFLPAAEKPHAERTEADTQTLNSWWSRVDWFLALRRAGLAPQFTEGGTKRQRV